jgi:hypothetical protein
VQTLLLIVSRLPLNFQYAQLYCYFQGFILEISDIYLWEYFAFIGLLKVSQKPLIEVFEIPLFQMGKKVIRIGFFPSGGRDYLLPIHA